MKGVVIKSTGSWYDVALVETKEVIACRIKGKFRLDGMKLTNPVAVGDEVMIEQVSNDYQIKEILPRKNYVVRQSPRKKHSLHILASNVDQVLLIVSIASPKLKQGFIDRFLLMTEPYDIPVIIVFNKFDIYDMEDIGVYEYLKEMYESIGYEVCCTSAIEKKGLGFITKRITDKTTLVAGQSGVGKSSLVNALDIGVSLRTHEISDYTGKGQHTTTFAEMFEIKIGGQLIDTPGIKNLSFNHLDIMDVAHNFREFFAVAKECKYNDCTHRNEPKCAVLQAVEDEKISDLRYQNYIQILREIEDQNYWELNTEF
ncbi:MAG: ribosome small subunit-dependent GTPase A [Saprospiraceae bacterium]|nr:ribosome small subunit-dependent GTPase A [Saprospiraceae bacterium]